jgi:hypothetical protein
MLKNKKTMKKIYLLIFVAFVCNSALHAQDIITLKSGDEIKAKVQEIGVSDVKYKKYENLDGPTYTLVKSDIFMIKYENGEKDIFTDAPAAPSSATSSVSSPEKKQEELHLTSSFWSGTVFRKANGKELSKQEVRSILADVPEALKKYNEGQRLHTLGYVYCGIGGGLLGIGLAGLILPDMDNDASLTIGGVGVVFATLGFVMDAVGNSDWKKAYNLYQNAKTKTTTSLNFGLTRSGGIGLTLTF